MDIRVSSVGGKTERILLYRYRLHNDVKEESMGISNIVLNHGWKDFANRQESLTPSVRSKKNPNGVLEYQEFDRLAGAVLFESDYYFSKKPTLYSREEVFRLDRNSLIELCKIYGVDYRNKNEKLIIELVWKSQQEYKVANNIEDFYNTNIMKSIMDEDVDITFKGEL